MILEIKDLDYKNIFSKLNLNVKEGDFICISGSTSCGKTTLIKIISGIYESNIKVFDMELNRNLKEIRKNIGIVFENPEDYFVAESVSEEIIFTLENLQVDKTIIEKRLNDVSNLLNINELLNLNPHSLSGGEKELVALAAALINNPKLLLIDGSFNMVEELKKQEIFEILKKLNKENKLTIIYTTNNLEDSLFAKELVLIDKKVVLKEKISKAFEDEEIFKKLKLELPFMASLSNKLKYYNLIDKTYLNMDKLVNELWK